MIPAEIVNRGLRMEHSQMSLGLVIALMITVNSIMLFGSVDVYGRYVVASLAFVFALISEYLLARQSMERSIRAVSVMHQLGARQRWITLSILGRFLLVGSVGIAAGFLVGVSVTLTLQAFSFASGLQHLLGLGFIGYLLVVGLASIGGITIGSYLGIKSTLELQDRQLRV